MTHFSSTFRAVTIMETHFCIWKIPAFWRLKLWNEEFAPSHSGNIHIDESKKPGFTCSIEFRINSKISRVILWSLYLPKMTLSSLLTEIPFFLHKICQRVVYKMFCSQFDTNLAPISMDDIVICSLYNH